MKNTAFKKWFPYIIMSILFAGMGLIAWFGVAPFQKYIVEKANDIQKFYASRENRQRQINRLPDLQNQFNLIKENEKALNVLVEEEHIVDFVKTLEGLASETNTQIVIQSQDDGEIQDKKTNKTARKPVRGNEDKETSILDALPYDRFLHISVTVNGEYADIIRFLHKMETLPYALDVVGAQMRIKPEEEKNGPQADNRNPFSLVAGGNVLSSQENTDAAPPEKPQGRVTATFDTVVYILKK